MPEPPPQTPQLDHAVLVVIDVQARLIPVMAEFGPALRNVQRLLDAASLLGWPVLASEQYPRGLGPTIPSVASRLADAPLEKLAFSCYGCEAFAAEVAEYRDVVLCGIEAHVCVLQTALSGLGAGQRVFVAADAVTSRAVRNRELALAQLRAAGAVVASTETLLFQLLQTAGTDVFRAVSRLVK